jgi:hypothetical protein
MIFAYMAYPNTRRIIWIGSRAPSSVTALAWHEVHFLEVPLDVREQMLRNPEISRTGRHPRFHRVKSRDINKHRQGVSCWPDPATIPPSSER